jgi:peptide/nickel transport system substrate-binding protein
MRSMRRVLGIVATLVLLVGCSGPAQPGQTGSSGQGSESGRTTTLRVSTLGPQPKVFHPYPASAYYTGPHTDAWTLLSASLISIDWDTLDYTADQRADMAKALPTISNNGRTFTYTLRDDLKWSDGRPIVADDFLFAFENARKEENDYVGLDDLERIERFTAPNPKTLEVTLDKQYARFLAIGYSSLGPVPKHVWEGKSWDDPERNPELLKPTVVNGPYMMKEVNVEQAVYARNPNWWGKRPNVDEIVMLSGTPATSLEFLKTRRADWAEQFPPAQYEEAKRLDFANVVEWTGATGTYRVMLFNMKRPFLSEKRVREALSRSVNRQDLVQYEEGLATPQYGFYTQGNTKWLNPNVEKYEFDMNRARQLLTEAGYQLQGTTLRGRDGQPVTLEIIYPTTSEPRKKIATYLQQQWKQLGIDATVTGLEFTTFTDKYARQKDFDIAMGTYGGGSFDPESTSSQIKTNGTQNSTGYSNPRVDELLELGKVEQDDAKRKQIYDEIQKIVMDELPAYYMVTTKNFTAFDKKVGGVKPLKGGDILQQNNNQFMDWNVAS